MAKQKKVTVNGTEYTLQSVSPTWYYDTNDECGNTGSGKKKSAEYMDRMFKNCVIAPAEVRNPVSYTHLTSASCAPRKKPSASPFPTSTTRTRCRSMRRIAASSRCPTPLAPKTRAP